MDLAWYARRVARMSLSEIVWRARDEVVQRRWRGCQVPAAAEDPLVVPEVTVPFASPLPGAAATHVSPSAKARLLAAADGLLDGHWPMFAMSRDDMAPAPDWFLDVRTGRRAPASSYAFDIEHRHEDDVGNIKYVWELSRHHQTTVLAASWHLSGDDRYAEAAAAQLESWWSANPFLSGIHWTSGIELGIRLLSWVWTRRLLDGWSGSSALFEGNPTFLRQLHHHQAYLATFPSRGTSANNHLIAELAGQFAAACAFPWFAESAGWREHARTGLRAAVVRQTFPSGLNRELATAYHGFVLELMLCAAIEAEIVGCSLDPAVWRALRSMCDALAAVVDVELRPPRQGDDDEGHGLVLDAPGYDRWASLLATGAACFGPCPWWPEVPSDDVRTPLWTSLLDLPNMNAVTRPTTRPSLLDGAGMALLRDRAGDVDELWCRVDHGPHGYLAIAAHAHADALAVEVRVGGVDVLADPGTYCYHGEPRLRTWFRSTRAHNTLEVGGVDQSVSGGPFLWSRHATTELEDVRGLDAGPVAEWRASHDGYRRLRPPATHRRTVRLERPRRTLVIEDEVECDGDHPCRLTYHLGPDVTCALADGVAELSWPLPGGRTGSATLRLPEALQWTARRGQDDPPDGWYSPSFDVRTPSTALVGTGSVRDGIGRTTLAVHDVVAPAATGARPAAQERADAGKRRDSS